MTDKPVIQANGIVTNDNRYSLLKPLPQAGKWVTAWGYHISLTRKPRWLTRVAVRILFEAKWENNNEHQK